MFCQRRLTLQAPLLARARRQVKAIGSASSALETTPSSALPDAQTMISAAEDLLGLDSSQVLDQNVSGSWHRFFNRLRSR